MENQYFLDIIVSIPLPLETKDFLASSNTKSPLFIKGSVLSNEEAVLPKHTLLNFDSNLEGLTDLLLMEIRDPDL